MYWMQTKQQTRLNLYKLLTHFICSPSRMWTVSTMSESRYGLAAQNIQGLFQPHAKYSRDRIQTHSNSDQDSAFTESECGCYNTTLFLKLFKIFGFWTMLLKHLGFWASDLTVVGHGIGQQCRNAK